MNTQNNIWCYQEYQVLICNSNNCWKSYKNKADDSAYIKKLVRFYFVISLCGVTSWGYSSLVIKSLKK